MYLIICYGIGYRKLGTYEAEGSGWKNQKASFVSTNLAWFCQSHSDWGQPLPRLLLVNLIYILVPGSG